MTYYRIMDEDLQKLILMTESDSTGTLSDFEDAIVDELPCFSDELTIGIVGNVDSGKSTTVGVLISGKLDDGRGSARLHVQLHQHEKRTGRTSSVTTNCIRTDRKVITFIDLPGHRRYLHTTMYGLSCNSPDFVLVMIGANMGLSHQTKEHLEITNALKIPFMIIITKVDMAPKNILKQTYNKIVKWIKSTQPTQNIMSS